MNLYELKTLDTIGNCQRPFFSLDVSQHMHKITNLSIDHRTLGTEKKKLFEPVMKEITRRLKCRHNPMRNLYSPLRTLIVLTGLTADA